MTLRLFNLPRIVSQLVRSQRCRVALQSLGFKTLALCGLTVGLPITVHAQSYDGLTYTNSLGVVGSAAVGASEAESFPHEQLADEVGVYVGPGGVTNPINMPSVLGSDAGAPSRTRYVNQPYTNGPFMQTAPVAANGGYDMGYQSCPTDAGCDVSYYGSVEALYFRREHDERFSLSQNSGLPPFDYEWGGRVTVGRLFDCVNAYEFSYAGPFEWEREQIATGAGLQSKLNPVGFVPAAVSTFNNATFHSQVFDARLNTFEANRRWWAWDIFSTLIGIRVVDYRESYGFASTSGAGNGLYLDRTKNLMIGPQIGGDLMQPLGLRTLVGVKGKAAALANFNRNRIFLQNNGINLLDAADSEIDLAGFFDFGAYIKYSITPSIRLSAGYDFWYIPGVATIPGQNLQTVRPSTGEKSQTDDELFIHGASFGGQILF